MDKEEKEQSGVGVLEAPEDLEIGTEGKEKTTAIELDGSNLSELMNNKIEEVSKINNAHIKEAEAEGASPTDIEEIKDAGKELRESVETAVDNSKTELEKLNNQISEIPAQKEVVREESEAVQSEQFWQEERDRDKAQQQFEQQAEERNSSKKGLAKILGGLGIGKVSSMDIAYEEALAENQRLDQEAEKAVAESELKKQKDKALGEIRNQIAKLKEKDPGYQNVLNEYKQIRNGSMISLYKEKEAELERAGLSSEAIEAQLRDFVLSLYETHYIDEALELQKQRKEIQAEAQKDNWIKKGANILADKYKAVNWKTKLAVSVALGVGIGTSTPIIAACCATGLGIQRALGGLVTTVGLEAAIKRSQEKDRANEGITQKAIISKLRGEIRKEHEKDLTAKKLLYRLEQQGENFDYQLANLAKTEKNEKIRRWVLAGGIGALIGSGWASEALGNIRDFGKNFLEDVSSADAALSTRTDTFIEPSIKTEAFGSFAGETSGLKPETLSVSENAPVVSAEAIASKPVFTFDGISVELPDKPLSIGSRGPEGAIIDYLQEHGVEPDKAGKQAHEMFLEFMKSDDAREFMAEKRIEESDYNELMRHIQGGAVEITSDGKIALVDVEYTKDAIERATEVVDKHIGETVSELKVNSDYAPVNKELSGELSMDEYFGHLKEQKITGLGELTIPRETVAEAVSEKAGVDKVLERMQTGAENRFYTISDEGASNMAETYQKAAELRGQVGGGDQVLAKNLQETGNYISNVVEKNWQHIKDLSSLSRQEYGVIKDLKIREILKKTYWGMTEETQFPIHGERNHLDLWRKIALRDKIKGMVSELKILDANEANRVGNLTVHEFLKKHYIKVS